MRSARRKHDDSTFRDLASGAIAGAAATIPMSWAMEVMHRALPAVEKHPLPPRQITDRILDMLDVERELDNEQEMWLSLAAHLGYGAAVGSIYATVEEKIPLKPLARGTVFGLGVWAFSYLGLLPALRLLKPATRHPPGRTALMIAAHVVWGSAMGIFSDLLAPEHKRQHPQFLRGGAASTRESPFQRREEYA